MYKPTLLLFFFLLSLSYSYAQKSQLEKRLDSLFAASFTPAAPGCAVLVAKKEKIIYKKAFAANVALNVPLSADMISKFASITKQFTAIETRQLAKQGRLSLMKSFQTYFPDFPSKGLIIIFKHLLIQTRSGDVTIAAYLKRLKPGLFTRL